MKKPELDRRAFCELAGLALVSVALPACGSAPPAMMCGAATVSVGPGSAIAVGTVKQVDRLGFDSIFVCRDALGVYAMSAACTHLRCTLGFVDQAKGFACACHTATFDYNGEQPTAPASVPLAHFAMCIDPMGNLLVDPDQAVAATLRYKA